MHAFQNAKRRHWTPRDLSAQKFRSLNCTEDRHGRSHCLGTAAPWTKDKLGGQKRPFKLKEIWAIRTRLQLSDRTRDLALFNLGIDSKLRACDRSSSGSATWPTEIERRHGRTLFSKSLPANVANLSNVHRFGTCRVLVLGFHRPLTLRESERAMKLLKRHSSRVM